MVLLVMFLETMPFTRIVEATELPKDVAAFVVRRNKCDHYRGEEADEPTRHSEIMKSLVDNCSGTDGELARLKLRYNRNSSIRKQLEGYDPGIEGTGARRH